MIKNIIFDFDGVLVDSEILVAKAFCQYLKNKNILFSEEEFAIYAGKKTSQVIEELSDKFNIKDQKSFFNDIMNIANNIYSKDLSPVIGVKKFLEESNYNYLIGSNSMKKRIIFGLKKVNFESFIKEENIFSFDMVDKPKPSPDIYISAINTYNLDKKETIIIEDSAVGVQAGVSAGIKVLGLTAGGHWHIGRSTKELTVAGAYSVFDNYTDISREIKNL